MDGDRFDGLTKAIATRRQVVKTGAKVAYVAPVVAATFPLTAAAAGSCACASGSVAIPGSIIAKLRQWGLSRIADALSGKCLGCQNGAIRAPKSDLQWRTACGRIGGTFSSVCPGRGNRIVLLAPTCGAVSV